MFVCISTIFINEFAYHKNLFRKQPKLEKQDVAVYKYRSAYSMTGFMGFERRRVRVLL